MNDLLRLDDRIALITGASQGIGKAIATLYAAHGAQVVIADIADELGAATAAELNGTFAHCDISREEDVRALVDDVIEKFGRIDILVNNAGYSKSDLSDRVPVDQYPIDGFRTKIGVDLHGTFTCCRLASPHMVKRQTGCIVNIASIAGVVALRNQIGHDAAKAAIIKMSEAMALELGPHGIRTNVISPGSTVTRATEKLFYENGQLNEGAKQLMTFIPLGRPGQPEDIAGAALYLASDLAAYVNGHNLVVDGGWTCGYNRNF
ncbi:MAG: glucose 1-dehydrogenase [Candidatus Latescibacteria bacterium]|nr:glucose 1-dehydrogenase [Candidatus Latescibacterota bacterium]